MNDDLTDPIAGRTGYISDLLAELTDEDLDRYERHWSMRHQWFAEHSDGLSSWWCSKFIARAQAEKRRRTA